jgi:hypothetical protein
MEISHFPSAPFMLPSQVSRATGIKLVLFLSALVYYCQVFFKSKQKIIMCENGPSIKLVGAHDNFSADCWYDISHWNILFAKVVENATSPILVFESLL